MQATLKQDHKLDKQNNLSPVGKYLTFILHGETYGLEILKVREIIKALAITPLPQAPKFLKGIINLRGKVIPVVDLRIRFGFPVAEMTKEACIIVMEINNAITGIVVDSVSEVLDIRDDNLDTNTDLGNGINTEILLGIAKVKDKLVILIDIDKILNVSGIVALEGLSEAISKIHEGHEGKG